MDLSYGVAETRAEELINEGADYDPFGNELFERDDEGRPKNKPSEKNGKKKNYESRNNNGKSKDPYAYNPDISLESDEPVQEKKKVQKHVNHNLNYYNFNEKKSSAFTKTQVAREENQNDKGMLKEKMTADQLTVNEAFEAAEREMEQARLQKIHDMQRAAYIKQNTPIRGRSKNNRNNKKTIKKSTRKNKESFLDKIDHSPSTVSTQVVLFDTNDKTLIFMIGAISAIIAFIIIKHFYYKYLHEIVKRYTPGKDNFKFPRMNFHRKLPEFLGGSKYTSELPMELESPKSSIPLMRENDSLSIFMNGAESPGLQNIIAGNYLKPMQSINTPMPIKSNNFYFNQS
jgi:hypothetical protein